MGVEGKERHRELDAGAQVLSGHMGKTIQRLRKAYNLSLSELAEQSGVAKSIISQIERNETNPTLATIWRLSQALDVSIDGCWPRATKSRSSRNRPAPTRRTCCLGRRQGAPRHRRLDQDHRVAAMVRRAGRTRWRFGFRPPPARLGGVSFGAGGRVRGRGRRASPSARRQARPCATAATAAIPSAASAPTRAAPRWCASSRRR